MCVCATARGPAAAGGLEEMAAGAQAEMGTGGGQ